MKKIKLIWEFRGIDAEKTAEHHKIHLHEYAVETNLRNKISGTEKMTDFYYCAFLVVDESEMTEVRDALLPQRGEWYNL